MLKKKTKNIRKKKKSERMAQGKPQQKFERNPWIRFRDNCDTVGRTDDGRQMTDKLRFHELCGHSQAELKINNIAIGDE